ncbi:MAG TPA: hypothetical protein VMJ70_13640 [Candidatus Sulfotelmatobacter sp.]|nr:hypothetical protein [Candidatus Sulfotelmatobacter sp.]
MRFAYPTFVVLASAFAVASLFFYGKVREGDRIIGQFVDQATRGVPAADTDAVAMALSREVFRRTGNAINAASLPIYERLEATSFFNVTSSVSLSHGIYGTFGSPSFGPCGTMSRVMLRALEQANIQSRKLQLLDDMNGKGGGHTMLEYRSNGRWVVLSPSDSSMVWQTHDGRLATLADIQGDSTIFAQIFERYPNYPFRFTNVSHIRWNKLPPAWRSAFRWLLGEQGYRDALTPYLYDRPRLLFFYLSLGAFAFCAALALVTRRAVRRGRRATAAVTA